MALFGFLQTATKLEQEISLSLWRSVQLIASVQSCYQPELKIAKSNDPYLVQAGDILTYTISYANTGSAVATGVVVVDILPLKTHFVTATGSFRPLIPSPGDILTWNVGSLDGDGKESVITLVVTVTEPLTHGTIITNQAWIACSQGISASSNVVSAVVQSTPTLRLAKKADPPYAVESGNQLTYTIIYSNDGNMIANGVWITDTLDQNIAIQSAYPVTTYQNDQIVGWDIGALSPVQSNQYITVVVDTGNLLGGAVITNVVFADADDASVVSCTVTTTIKETLQITNYLIYFPVIMKGYCNCCLDEPNDFITTARYVASGQTYCALPDDLKDYFSFELRVSSTISVAIHNYEPDEHGDLVLRKPIGLGHTEVISQWGRKGTSKFIFPIPLDAGMYYIQVWTAPGYTNTISYYTLRVDY